MTHDKQFCQPCDYHRYMSVFVTVLLTHRHCMVADSVCQCLTLSCIGALTLLVG